MVPKTMVIVPRTMVPKTMVIVPRTMVTIVPRTMVPKTMVPRTMVTMVPRTMVTMVPNTMLTPNHGYHTSVLPWFSVPWLPWFYVQITIHHENHGNHGTETMVFTWYIFVRGLTVGKNGLIFIGYNKCQKIQVFKQEGGKAIREIKCNRFVLFQMFAITSNQTIVVKVFCNTSFQNQVQVIHDVSGATIHRIGKDGYDPYPAVCQDDSVIIAWVEHGQGLLSIIQYTKELKYIKDILTGVKIPKSYVGFLQAFNTGEIALCTGDMLYIFHETWE